MDNKPLNNNSSKNAADIPPTHDAIHPDPNTTAQDHNAHEPPALSRGQGRRGEHHREHPAHQHPDHSGGPRHASRHAHASARGRHDLESAGHDNRRHRRGRRMFGYGELRTIVLQLIASKPSHGYELIREIEDRSGGAYSPSPGVIYPTLSWLVDMGYALVEASDGGRKLYSITENGRSFLKANRQTAETLSGRPDSAHGSIRRGPRLPEIRAAMGTLKQAIRNRIHDANLSPEAIEEITTLILETAQKIEEKP